MLRKQRSRLVVLLIVAMVAPVAYSQSGGGSGGGGRPGGGTGGGTRPSTGNTGGTRTRPRDFPERRIIFISGNVITNDGSPLPEPAVIERICGSNTRREANTDAKGFFTFQLGNRAIGMFQDASVGGGGDYNMVRSDGPFSSGPNTSGLPAGGGSGDGGEGVSRYELMGCELRASVPGFRSSVLHLDNVQYLSQNNVGTIVLARMGDVQGSTVSVSMLQAPKDAKKAYEKGHEAFKKGKIDDARKHLQKSLDIYPKMAPAHYDLGFIEQSAKNNTAAREHYAKAMEIDPNYVQPLVQMASLHAIDQNWAEAAKLTEKAVQLDPIDFPVAFFYNAVANLNLGKVDEAEKSARKALQLDGGHSIARLPLLMAKILEFKKDYAGAAEQVRTYLKISPDAADAAAARENLAKLEKSAGQAPTASQP